MDIKAENQGVKLRVKVVPNSAKDQVVGWLDGRLKVKVCAQPEKGKANKAVAKLLIKSLKLSSEDISLISGASNSLKVFKVELSQEQLNQRIDELLQL